jgi:hypothetical protein
MTETEKMQQLHLKAAQGHKLSAKDAAKLKNWYETLDREESIINQNNRQIDVTAIKNKIEKTSQKIVVVTNEISTLLKQNEQIRLENQQLRQVLESSLLEQVA